MHINVSLYLLLQTLPPKIYGIVLGFALRCYGSSLLPQNLLNQQRVAIEALRQAVPAAVAAAAEAAAPHALIAEERNFVLALQHSGENYCGALCIGFDSESQGFASTLARIFQRVYKLHCSIIYNVTYLP